MAEGLPVDENFMGLELEYSDPDAAGVVVLSAPFEATSSYGTGSQLGPAAILDASHQVEFYDAALGFEPVQACGGIATLAQVMFDDLMDQSPAQAGEDFANRLAEVAGFWLDRGKFVVTLGGEHSSIVGAVRAHAQRVKDLTVIQLDAHSDLRDQYLDNPWSHASALRRIMDFHDHAVQVGIRSEESNERHTARSLGVKTFYAHQIARQVEAGEDWISPIIAAARKNVYITLDADVFDPSIIPATGTPEPGGLTWYQIDRFIQRVCAERNVVGLDVSELAPIDNLPASQFTLAKLIYRFLGYRFQR